MYYRLCLEVSGGLGPRTVLDRFVHPPSVERVHLIFDGWLGDALVECFPCYFAARELVQELLRVNATGFQAAAAEVEASELFTELYPTRVLPEFLWLKIVGRRATNDDMYLSGDHRLCVSRKVLDQILATAPRGLEYLEVPERLEDAP